MTLNKYKILLPLFIFLLAFIFISSTDVVRAADINCENIPTSGNYAPEPGQILCPFFKLINVGIMLGGAVFAIMIGVGAIKLATALGDPKGLEGASKTWTYAIVGVAVVLGAVTIVNIVAHTFGLNIVEGGVANLFNKAQDAINNFILTVYN